MTKYNLLDEPIIWQALVVRLNGRSAHDAVVIADFSKHCNVPLRDILAKMKTHLHVSSATTLN